MQRFLETCAEFVLRKYGDELKETVIVVPNRRSGLFFTAYLRERLPHAVIGPQVIPVNEWICAMSELHAADPLRLIATLYEVYVKETGTKESFDDFYFWGEVLLSDFDDIDKYLVPAEDLFRNLLSLKEMELYFDYLTEEQKKTIVRFWGSLKSWEQFEHEKDFLFIWEKLGSIYSGFREKLHSGGEGYAGMIMRDGLSKLQSGKYQLPRKNQVIIGMNALNKCEKQVFSHLRNEGKAVFLWDYDDYYLNNPVNTAGKFIRENLELFPPPPDFLLQTDHFSRKKKIELVAFPSLTGQSQIIPEILKTTGEDTSTRFDHTAVVLADESLLFHTLGAIPADAPPVNVTMGYPVKNSPVVSLLNLITTLLRRTAPGKEKDGFYFKPVLDLLSHQLLRDLETDKVNAATKEWKEQNLIYIPPEKLFFSGLHQCIFTLPQSVAAYPGYFLNLLRQLYTQVTRQPENTILKETIYATYLALEKLEAVMERHLRNGVFDISPAIFFRLMMQYLNKVAVPFEGEPLSGIQVMGILETRCLDFERLIIIGLNEDEWPKGDAAPSMIPYSMRKAFGLPGIDDQDAMYSYYFYRLIQRTEEVTATWNSVREALSGGELSRLGFQLELHSPHQVVKRNFDYPLMKNNWTPLTAVSSETTARRLLDYNLKEKPLSPSAIVAFLHCRMKFYLSYVVGLREEEEVKEDIDRMVFGNIFHKAMETLYLPFTGKIMQEADFSVLLNDKGRIEKAVMEAFTSEFYKSFKGKETDIPLEGKALLIKSTVMAYIRNVLEYDQEQAPITLVSLEKPCNAELQVDIDGHIRQLRIGGRSDRLDEKEGILRIVDYKTGTLKSGNMRFPTFEQLFDTSRKELKKEAIQSLIYAWIVHRQENGSIPVKAAVYPVLSVKKGMGNSDVMMDKSTVVMPESSGMVESFLQEILRDIYSQKTEFFQTPFSDRCSYCPFSGICRRG